MSNRGSPQAYFLSTLPRSQSACGSLKTRCRFRASFAISSFVLLLSKSSLPMCAIASIFSLNFCTPRFGSSKFSSIILPGRKTGYLQFFEIFFTRKRSGKFSKQNSIFTDKLESDLYSLSFLLWDGFVLVRLGIPSSCAYQSTNHCYLVVLERPNVIGIVPSSSDQVILETLRGREIVLALRIGVDQIALDIVAANVQQLRLQVVSDIIT